jgi:hypothetical protein
MDLDLDLSLDLNLNLKLDSQVEMDLDPAEHDLGDGAEVEHEEELPLLAVPRTSNAELQMTMDAVAERLNGLVRARAVSSPAPPSLPLDYRRSTKRTVSRSAREDKENQSVVEEGWSYVAADEYLGGVGLGVGGVNAKMGKEMGNVVFMSGNGADSKAKKDRERKGKREFFILYSSFSRTKRLSRLHFTRAEAQAIHHFPSCFAHHPRHGYQSSYRHRSHDDHFPLNVACRWRIQRVVLESLQLEGQSIPGHWRHLLS